MPKAIVIGAGIGGLAVAIRLAAKGYAVQVFDKNNHLGGKLNEFKENGFRFDTGPSLFTMPAYFEDLFTAAGKNLVDYLPYKLLDASCTYFYPDHASFKFYRDELKLKEALGAELQTDLPAVKSYLNSAKKLYDTAGKLFVEKSLHQRSTYFSKQALKALPHLLSPKNLSTLHRKNKANFKNKKWVQLFDRYATYNGSSPYKTPAMMAVIPHLEHNIGTFFPQGGMYGIVKAMETLALELGVEFQLNQQVEEIIIKNKNAVGVVVANTKYMADKVISNMDIALTYKYLLKNEKYFLKEDKKERSSSGLVFYWGMKDVFPQLSLHNILFSEAYKLEFNEIFSHGKVPLDPTIYINISSKESPDDAPPKNENWFVMINTPAGIDLNDVQIAQIKEKIILAIERGLKVEISSKIIVEKILTPKDIQINTLGYKGALYGTASNSLLSSFKRHSNFSKLYKNLYFVGGTVHPGGGIPLCLNSAKIVADTL
ncbi:phytoene desaturase [Putridiphycobacter roseus]|uniref:Phytoene desaturase n=1 Tax=Putridiphycobacter roseus TaxID=2219161 RepID=A0A2W1MY23_9FLAO|nr:1-hydroxycarotenoid 3,4-desaturase CrtD [Putridiphycobacter roseus]PZE17069.1 phytoene desaturase [Putridiphycobacter roseus]